LAWWKFRNNEEAGLLSSPFEKGGLRGICDAWHIDAAEYYLALSNLSQPLFAKEGR
jgi:hypothetical protein